DLHSFPTRRSSDLVRIYKPGHDALPQQRFRNALGEFRRGIHRIWLFGRHLFSHMLAGLCFWAASVAENEKARETSPGPSVSPFVEAPAGEGTRFVYDSTSLSESLSVPLGRGASALVLVAGRWVALPLPSATH